MEGKRRREKNETLDDTKFVLSIAFKTNTNLWMQILALEPRDLQQTVSERKIYYFFIIDPSEINGAKLGGEGRVGNGRKFRAIVTSRTH